MCIVVKNEVEIRDGPNGNVVGAQSLYLCIYLQFQVWPKEAEQVVILEQQPAKKRGEQPVELAFNIKTRKELNVIIGRLFYSARSSFNLIRILYYSMVFKYATNNPIANHKTSQIQLMTSLFAKWESSYTEDIGAH